MGATSRKRGRTFELEIENLLRAVERQFPSLVTVASQERLRLRDGRLRVLDFSLDYVLGGTRNRIAVECQDRKSWSTSIIDKIATIRNETPRNRFWFIYYDPEFLTADAKSIFDNHGIMAFSLEGLKAHLEELTLSLRGALAAESLRRIEGRPSYESMIDPAPPEIPELRNPPK